jgi:hypothetical protein
MTFTQLYHVARVWMLSISLLGIVALSGCGDATPINPPQPPEVAEVTLSFELFNGTDPVAFQEAFTDEGGFQHQVLTLKFYLSNVELIKSDGGSVVLDDVILFDYEPEDETVNNPEWTRTSSATIPPGEYSGIRFGLGIPATLNDEDPTTFANDDPLSTFSNMYWNWASKYRFIILETATDTGSGNFDHDILIHTGLDELYRESPVYPINMVLESGDRSTLHLELDWNAIWYNSEDVIPIKTEHITHTTDTPEDFDLAKRFTDNFMAGLNIAED